MVLIGMASYFNSLRWANEFCRYEREAWDLFGIYFENHPDLCVVFTFVPLSFTKRTIFQPTNIDRLWFV